MKRKRKQHYTLSTRCTLPHRLVSNWQFVIVDWQGNSVIVNEAGQEKADEKPFRGTERDAALEADLRADLWEAKNKKQCARVVYESCGVTYDKEHN